ncbi:hypothetical protein ACFSJU_12265 [Paradesertivirga mongoliensis]|uniref:Lipocalin-like domain-containing protein n=1 Tax=Paradesertivirga mongoliensis TaxID=2100740 RepID=A0ABW4ZNM3_9SPHI|nr:hypothetical protein [Pedobacter mongoliensis]
MKRFVILLSFMIVSAASYAQKKFNGTFSNGYKGAKISFELSKDGKTIENLTFTGYWRCGSSTEQITAGPEKSIPVKGGKVQAIIVDPENGGSSAFRFEIDGIIKGNAAQGTFRMSITGLSCDTYKLNWTASSK